MRTEKLGELPLVDFYPVDYGQQQQAFGFEVSKISWCCFDVVVVAAVNFGPIQCEVVILPIYQVGPVCFK